MCIETLVVLHRQQTQRNCHWSMALTTTRKHTAVNHERVSVVFLSYGNHGYNIEVSTVSAVNFPSELSNAACKGTASYFLF